jgi:hypothetical protein
MNTTYTNKQLNPATAHMFIVPLHLPHKDNMTKQI